MNRRKFIKALGLGAACVVAASAASVPPAASADPAAEIADPDTWNSCYDRDNDCIVRIVQLPGDEIRVNVFDCKEEKWL